MIDRIDEGRATILSSIGRCGDQLVELVRQGPQFFFVGHCLAADWPAAKAALRAENGKYVAVSGEGLDGPVVVMFATVRPIIEGVQKFDRHAAAAFLIFWLMKFGTRNSELCSAYEAELLYERE